MQKTERWGALSIMPRSASDVVTGNENLHRMIPQLCIFIQKSFQLWSRTSWLISSATHLKSMTSARKMVPFIFSAMTSFWTAELEQNDLPGAYLFAATTCVPEDEDDRGFWLSMRYYSYIPFAPAEPQHCELPGVCVSPTESWHFFLATSKSWLNSVSQQDPVFSKNTAHLSDSGLHVDELRRSFVVLDQNLKIITHWDKSNRTQKIRARARAYTHTSHALTQFKRRYTHMSTYTCGSV